jgi:nudix-type nucleoside diphosphatase (YffH/AdpP family)
MTREIAAVETVHDGWARMLVATIRSAAGETFRREIEHHGDAVAVLPFDPERRVAMLVRQFRAPVLHAAGPASILEAPAGILDEPEPEACARREALEEAGLALGALTCVARAWTMPGISTERMHFFLATYSAAAKIGSGGGLAKENEDTEPVEVALDELAPMVEDGRLEDAKTILLVCALRLRRPELFTEGSLPPDRDRKATSDHSSRR